VTSDGYLRFPHLHGDLLTFVAEGDVWLAPASGGRSWRVSADQATASYPRLSADGTQIAWTSERDGAAEVYLASTEGGGRRLTYWGDGDTKVCGWSPVGEVLAVSAAGQPFPHFTWAYALATDGGAPRRLPYGPVSDVAIIPGAVALLTARSGRDLAAWKRYRGGTAGRLWLARTTEGRTTEGRTTEGADSGEGFVEVAAGVAGQFASPMLVAGRLAFLSDHEGTANVYSCTLDGTDLRRHTDHDGFYARNASTDGTRVVYQCAGDIWLLEDLDGQARPLDVILGSARLGRNPALVSADDHLGSLSVDQSGQGSAVEVRGTVHWLTHKDGPARALTVTPRARLPRVLGSTGQVAWVTDAGGEQAIEIAPVSGSAGGAVSGSGDSSAGGSGGVSAGGSGGSAGVAGGPRRLAAGQFGRVSELAAAPDGATLAVASRDGRLLLVEVTSGQVRELTACEDGPVTGLTFSPDSAWLAWSHPGPDPLSRIRLARVSGQQASDDSAPAQAAAATEATGTAQAAIAAGVTDIIDVTDGRFADTDPVFTADGKFLALLSRRSFDPVYDAHFFDLSFPFGGRPYLVPLAADTPSPFAPLPDGRPVGHSGSGHSGSGDDDDAEGSGPVAVRVDAEGMPGRVVPLPVPESRYSSLAAVKGGLAWLREPVAGVLGEGAADPAGAGSRACLERFDLERRNCTTIVGELDWFEVSGDGTRIVVGDEGEVRVLSSERKEDDSDEPGDTVTVDLSKARFLADPAALWRHAYDEVGRIIRHDFWVADMAGIDWDAALDQYRPLLGRIANSSDFTDLLWELVGELGTSHAYVRAVRAGRHADRVGLLGADLERDDDGTWRVARVLPGESSDPLARSPLAAPGAGVRAGDALLAVDGQAVDPRTGPAPLLVGAVRTPVELTVGPAGGGSTRRVVVVPLADDSRLYYQDWVATQRRRVRELSGGRLGYLHVPDMMGEGWAHFHRDLRVEMRCDALIVDVRGNRGGHTSELVIEKLARRVLGWEVPRGVRPGTYPRDAPRGPVVALTDEFAGSDGDIVTGVIHALGLGPVVGTRTWGGVIGIDSSPDYELIDGTMITVPKYAFWLNGYGWELENRGVDPDLEVLCTPDDWGAGRDPQLDTAVRLALEALETRPPARPPDTSLRPDKSRPPLPPRS
jgi:tricorn protease